MMVGGLDCEEYNYKITADNIKQYFADQGITIRGTLSLIGFGIVVLINASMRREYDNEDCHIEQVAIFKDESGNIYIARGNYPYNTEKDPLGNTIGVIRVMSELGGNTTSKVRSILSYPLIPSSELYKSKETKDKKRVIEKISDKLETVSCRKSRYSTYTVKSDPGDNFYICVFEVGPFSPVCELVSRKKLSPSGSTYFTIIDSIFSNYVTAINISEYVIDIPEAKYPEE
jgi:hypothetical protein